VIDRTWSCMLMAPPEARSASSSAAVAVLPSSAAQCSAVRPSCYPPLGASVSRLGGPWGGVVISRMNQWAVGRRVRVWVVLFRVATQCPARIRMRCGYVVTLQVVGL
jgi:hypothetical protein